MNFEELLKNLVSRIRMSSFSTEASVSQGIVLPILNKLGWDIFNTNVVVPEYSVQSRRVDYALFTTNGSPNIFIEVKKVGLTDGADKQLFEYAFHLGVPFAILTDGQSWSFYLPGEQGKYDERRVYKIDLLERELDEIVYRFNRYLSYENNLSGKALEYARKDYRDNTRNRIISEKLPLAWNQLIKESDTLLLELLADKVEDICGYKPDLEVCSDYLLGTLTETPVSSPPNPVPNLPLRPRPLSKPSVPIPSSGYSFTYKNKTYSAKNARGVMIELMRLVQNDDPNFFDRFILQEHGKKRRYLAKNKYDLYPGRPDLADGHSIEIFSGWWLGTNYSRAVIQNVLDLLIEVADPKVRSTINANVL